MWFTCQKCSHHCLTPQDTEASFVSQLSSLNMHAYLYLVVLTPYIQTHMHTQMSVALIIQAPTNAHILNAHTPTYLCLLSAWHLYPAACVQAQIPLCISKPRFPAHAYTYGNRNLSVPLTARFLALTHTYIQMCLFAIWLLRL